MLELAAIAGASVTAALSGALMPGPVLAVTIAGARRHGFWYGPRVVLGHALVEVPVVVALMLGLKRYVEEPSVLGTIAGIGAAAMVWMSVGMVRQALRFSDEEGPGESGTPRDASATPDEGDAEDQGLGGIRAGAITSAANPYWYVWWATMGAAMVASAAVAGWLGIAVFFIAHISVDLGWLAVVSLGVSRGRRFLQGRAYSALLLVCAAILVLTAAGFAYLAAGQLHAALVGA
jgi:threonine/homoserine/homoserine lactone efflux protein